MFKLLALLLFLAAAALYLAAAIMGATPPAARTSNVGSMCLALGLALGVAPLP